MTRHVSDPGTGGDPDRFIHEVRGFWERRGMNAPTTDARLTMLMEHERYAAYINERELHYLLPRVRSLGRPRAINLGCGHGRLSLALAPFCEEIIGLDASESLIQLASAEAHKQGLHNIRFAQHEAAMPWAEPGTSEFDLIVCSGLLNCLTDAECKSTMAWVAPRLRAGGLLYLRNNVANLRRFERHASDGESPGVIRTAEEYVDLVKARDELQVLDERYLFPPLCAPNLAYYHALPSRVRETKAMGAVLDAWFSLERVTSDARLKWLSGVYPSVLRIIRKPTSFRVLVATRVIGRQG